MRSIGRVRGVLPAKILACADARKDPSPTPLPQGEGDMRDRAAYCARRRLIGGRFAVGFFGAAAAPITAP
jgi:hypothetical protein